MNDPNDIKTLGSVETKLDVLISSFAEHRQEMREALAAHEKRISEGERWRSRMTGLGIGSGAVIAALYGLMFRVLSLLS